MSTRSFPTLPTQPRITTLRTRARADGSGVYTLRLDQGEWPTDQQLLDAYAPGRTARVRVIDERERDIYFDAEASDE